MSYPKKDVKPQIEVVSHSGRCTFRYFEGDSEVGRQSKIELVVSDAADFETIFLYEGSGDLEALQEFVSQMREIGSK